MGARDSRNQAAMHDVHRERLCEQLNGGRSPTRLTPEPTLELSPNDTQESGIKKGARALFVCGCCGGLTLEKGVVW